MSEPFEQDRDELADADLTTLYRETQDLEPPPRLDSRILAAAREAIRPPKTRRIRRWTVPLSMAAVLVLAIGLVSLIKHPMSPDASLSIRRFSPEEQAESASALPSTPAPASPAPPPTETFTDREKAPMEGRAVKGEALEYQEKPDQPVLPPELWLEHIAKLYRQGRTAEAEASLQALRRHYPDYPLALPETADQ